MAPSKTPCQNTSLSILYRREFTIVIHPERGIKERRKRNYFKRFSTLFISIGCHHRQPSYCPPVYTPLGCATFSKVSPTELPAEGARVSRERQTPCRAGWVGLGCPLGQTRNHPRSNQMSLPTAERISRGEWAGPGARYAVYLAIYPPSDKRRRSHLIYLSLKASPPSFSTHCPSRRYSEPWRMKCFGPFTFGGRTVRLMTGQWSASQEPGSTWHSARVSATLITLTDRHRANEPSPGESPVK